MCAKLRNRGDALLNNEHLKRWRRWELQLPSEQQVPRPIVHYREKVQEVELHSFGDASISGVGAAVYAVVRQESGTTQRLVFVHDNYAVLCH